MEMYQVTVYLIEYRNVGNILKSKHAIIMIYIHKYMFDDYKYNQRGHFCDVLIKLYFTNTQKIKSSNGRLWGCQTGAKSEHPKVVQNSSFEWVVEWLL